MYASHLPSAPLYFAALKKELMEKLAEKELSSMKRQKTNVEDYEDEWKLKCHKTDVGTPGATEEAYENEGMVSTMSACSL
ncbi:hypothetical protein SCLCIDRAFT_31930 [Scleroderma citrinum Foug A]|uniref:Uncharacterized protein n=1 Tax=Scleroderma citrinum Foug A TaxID=1036808 RepID=A0A0C3DB86_9AGAM|nr:hypothetical protein SCLCIDRAFT_31930 [Scleroderma citrinum Foug A]